MKVGVLGDVHCHAPNLEAALGFFASEQVSRVVCTGDVVDGEPEVNHLVNDAIRLLRDERVATVRGNHDVWLLEDAPGLSLPSPEQPIDRDGLDWLRELPPTLSFAMGACAFICATAAVRTTCSSSLAGRRSKPSPSTSTLTVTTW